MPVCFIRFFFFHFQRSSNPFLRTDNHDPDTYVNTKEMLDNFSKEIVYMKMLMPYTQTLFVELIRFTPGQPDGLYSQRHGITPSMGRQAMAATPAPHIRHVPHPPTHNPPPVNGFITDRQMGVASPHVPPPPPWSRWSTTSIAPAAPPPQGPRPGSRAVGTPPSSKKRKFVDTTPSDMAAESSIKRQRPQTPPITIPPRPAVSSPSLAKVLAPSDSQIPSRPTVSTSTPTISAALAKSSPSRTSTPGPVRSVKLVMSKSKQGS